MIQENAEQPVRSQDAEAHINGQRLEIQRLTARNDTALQTLAQQGAAINIPMVSIFVLLDVLLGSLDGDNATLERVAYELQRQQTIATIIADLEKQVRQRTLLAGLPQDLVPNGLMPH